MFLYPASPALIGIARRSARSTSRRAIVFHQPIHYSVDVFAVNAWALHAIDRTGAIVIACLAPCENLAAVHHIRLEVHDWTLVKPRGHKVAGVDIPTRSDFR